MMKVSQMREDIDINGKDTEQRTNERTNEKTNERASERIEQRFMNEILSETQKIEENSFFGHDNRLFRQLLQNIENCYQQYFM